MLTGPLAAKRMEDIAIFRRLNPDDMSKYSRILPAPSIPNEEFDEPDLDNTIRAIMIPILREDIIFPGGPVNADPQFAAYIDQQPANRVDVRIGDIVKRKKIERNIDLPQLFVIGYYQGEYSDRIDLVQQGGVF